MKKKLVIVQLVVLLVAGLLQACSSPAEPKSSSGSTECAGAASVGRVVAIKGGVLERGSVAFQPEEQVGGSGVVADFDIDATEVTTAQFARFVAATDYVTVAERSDATGRPLGAAVFDRETGKWRIDSTANWRQPQGAGSQARDDAPVVAVAYEDAVRYAQWLGRRLPTEIEWEYAARGGAQVAVDIESERRDTAGSWLANTWQGAFPNENTSADGYAGVAPVGCFAPNIHGVYDMIGNVWEWTNDWYSPRVAPASFEQSQAEDREAMGKRMIKGGSHLCADNFCSRYRSGSRQPADTGLGTSHIGFRTVGTAAATP